MAKTNDAPATELLPSPSPSPSMPPATAPVMTYRDKVYTSRTLIIPGTGRTLPVVKGVVDVSASDETALSYLKAHQEFEPLG